MKMPKPLDRFAGRLIIPIHDHQGWTVGFGAREIAGREGQAKYINSPTTAVFQKKHLLFGINEAREKIRKERRAILVEGYFDVMALHNAEVRRAQF